MELTTNEETGWEMNNEIKLPMPVQFILNRLYENGYEGYIVGGCVRDCIMNNKPHDWDICTSALPEQIIEVFKDCKVLPTGIQHGTVSIVFDDSLKPYNIFEVTTYRVDGEYKDNRHPEKVEFVSNLRDDLARRDFTINAMAYNEKQGLIDLFGGVRDIKNKVIRCVGNPTERFNEDALRIMRALRFSICLGFEIDEATLNAANDNLNLIKNISIERICSELTKVFHRHMFDVFPNDNMKSRMKILDPIYMFLLNVIEAVLPDGMYSASGYTLKRLWYANSPHLEVNLAIIFDVPNYIDILKYLRFSNEIINTINDMYIYGHKIADDYPDWTDIKNRRADVYYARKLIHDITHCPSFLVNDFAKSIIIVDRDKDYHNPNYFDQDVYSVCLTMLDLTISNCRKNQDVYDLKYMAINGNDLKELGYKGREIGMILSGLLDLVMQDKVKNNKDDLIIAIPQVMTDE